MMALDMTCPIRDDTLCTSSCAWLLESDYGHGSGKRVDSDGFYVCAMAKLAVGTDGADGLYISNKA